MKKLLYFSAAVLLLVAVWFYANKRKPISPQPSDVPVAAADSPSVESVPVPKTEVATSDAASSQPGGEPADVLSATNLEQWKSLIKDLKQDRVLRDYWASSRSRAGAPPVLLKQNGQSITYKAAAVDVSVVPKTTDFMEAQIYSPRMDIDDTRALGMSLCSMFGFDSNKFLSWCNTAGTNWLDVPTFNIGDHSHSFNVRMSYNKEKPWYIIFTVQDKNAVARLTRRSSP